jgi:hypothetical protein
MQDNLQSAQSASEAHATSYLVATDLPPPPPRGGGRLPRCKAYNSSSLVQRLKVNGPLSFRTPYHFMRFMREKFTSKLPQLLKIFSNQSLGFPLLILKIPNPDRTPVLFVWSCAGWRHLVVGLGDTNLSENNTASIFKWTEYGSRILYLLKVSVTSYQVIWCHNSEKHNNCLNCRRKIKCITLINLSSKKRSFFCDPTLFRRVHVIAKSDH